LKEIQTTSIYTHSMVLFEIVPSSALLNAVGKDEMAYAGRDRDITVVTFMEWKSKVETGTEKAAQELQAAREMSHMLITTCGFGGGFGKLPVYGNYGE
jgi:hypothetical protein